MTTTPPADSSLPPPESAGLEGAIRDLGSSIAQLALSNKADNDRADRRARHQVYLLGGATALLLVGTLGIGFTAREQSRTAERVEALAGTVGNLAAEQRETRAEAAEAAEHAKEAAEAAPRIEVAPPPSAKAPPRAVLVIPARPAKSATPAAGSASAVPAAPPAPAVSIPLPLPAGATGGGP
jgi:hypothetical protein